MSSHENICKKVDFDQPQMQEIDWDHPENKWMRENVKGYYQKFQDNWLVQFSSKYDKDAHDQSGCQVWVSKKSGDAKVVCSRFDLLYLRNKLYTR